MNIILPLAVLIFVALGCTPSNRQAGPATPLPKASPTPTLTTAQKKEKRESAIEDMERKFLSKGMDVHFSWPQKDTLKMRYVLMSRPIVYQIQNETDFVQTLGELGVKKLILTDGYRETWTIEP